MYSKRTRGSSQKLQKGKIQDDIRKNFPTMKVVKYWSKLPREAENFKTELNISLRSLVSYGPALGKGKAQLASRGPFQPKLVCDSVI